MWVRCRFLDTAISHLTLLEHIGHVGKKITCRFLDTAISHLTLLEHIGHVGKMSVSGYSDLSSYFA